MSILTDSIPYVREQFSATDLMFDGKYRTIRETADIMSMSTRTVFDWRHKILSGLDLAITEGFIGIVEMDDLHFTLSNKGRRGLMKSKKRGTAKKKRGDRGVYHVNNLNQKANEIKKLVNGKLQGVSTKYLQNYMNWFKLVQLKSMIGLEMFDSCFMKSNAWYDFHNREERYMNFVSNFSDIKY